MRPNDEQKQKSHEFSRSPPGVTFAKTPYWQYCDAECQTRTVIVVTGAPVSSQRGYLASTLPKQTPLVVTALV